MDKMMNMGELCIDIYTQYTNGYIIDKKINQLYNNAVGGKYNQYKSKPVCQYITHTKSTPKPKYDVINDDINDDDDLIKKLKEMNKKVGTVNTNDAPISYEPYTMSDIKCNKYAIYWIDLILEYLALKLLDRDVDKYLSADLFKY
jgi:hypothetical protein